jgi:putative transcriptional regulator
MEADSPVSLKGHFLMAMPGLTDPNFHQTVTCLCEHNEDGALGIIVNRVHSSLCGKDIFEELGMNWVPGAFDIPIHIGGPVHLRELFVLHGPPHAWEGTLMVTASVGLSNTRDILEAIAEGHGPREFIICLGCAGWGPGQLEAEIKENAWLTLPVFEENIFELPIEMRWEEAVRKMGIDPSWLSNISGHA